MNFASDDDLQKFINHEKYFKSIDNFCLGHNLSDAGEILKKIADSVEKEKKAKGAHHEK